jgi:hypothetical protein
MPVDSRPPEIGDILLIAARSRPTALDLHRLRETVARDPDWTALVQTALAHGVAGLLCRHLLTAAVDMLPNEIRDAATAFLAYRTQAHADGVSQLLDLLDAFTAAGIVAAPYKGPALAHMVYAEPALRGFRDLDILINEADVPAALALLQRLGYRSQYPELRERHRRAYHRYNGQDVLSAEGRLPVEPHWQLGQRTLAAPVDVTGMLRRLVPATLGGRGIAVLSGEDALLAAGFHGSKEEWTSLRCIVDMAELLRTSPTLDWDALLFRATRAGVRRMVLLGVWLAHDVLAAEVPPPTLRHIAADTAIVPLANVARAKLFIGGAAERSVFDLSVYRWRMRERLSDRLRYARATICTARVKHFQALDLSDGLGFLYPGVKLLHDYVALPLWLARKTATAQTVEKTPE